MYYKTDTALKAQKIASELVPVHTQMVSLKASQLHEGEIK